MKQPTKQASRHVQALLAALDILDCFQEQPYLTIGELVERTGHTRNRVMRLAGTLEYRNYLTYAPHQGGYFLGPKVMFLGKMFERSHNLLTLSRPILQRLVQQTGESASLYIREGLERVVLAREEGTQPLRFSVTEGQRMELYAGAGGKVLLAHAPEEVLQELLQHGNLPRLTENTLADAKLLRQELERIRRQGFAVSLAERAPDTGAISAPVFDDEGQVIAAIAIAGPSSRIANLMKEHGEGIVIEAAQDLSRLLGWRKDSNNPNPKGEKGPC